MKATVTAKVCALCQHLAALVLVTAVGVSGAAVAQIVTAAASGNSPSVVGQQAQHKIIIQPVQVVLPQNRVALVSYEVIGFSEEPIFLNEDQYLDLEAEGWLLDQQPVDEESLRSGVWQQLYPELYEQGASG